jgi:NADH-quinone oxidoreductase subunit F
MGDARFSAVAATSAETAAIDAVLGTVATGEGPAPRHLLLPALHGVTDRMGWISPGAVDEIGRRLDLAPAEVYGVASFYEMFSLEPRPAHQVAVCVDLTCRLAGGTDLLERTRADAGPETGVHASPCLGLCERAPAATVRVFGEAPVTSVVAPASAPAILEARAGAPPAPAGPPGHVDRPRQDPDGLVLLRRVGRVDPTDLDAYRAAGGYDALRRALAVGPAGVLAELRDARLLGRGGAAFPVATKWQAVASNPDQPHYLVCNADESEPGTFKDRVLLEGDPFSVIESMTIAALATGCRHGFLYVRGEYAGAAALVERGLEQARRRGLIGRDILGHDFEFDIEVRRGGGAYICGEETALFNSLEGFRGEPRSKPPFPVDAGLFGRPTVVNNVETLVNVPSIVLGGGAAFARTGTAGSSGTKLFAVSGAVALPGVYEVPFGTTLRRLLELAGGVAGGRALRAVLLGGAAGIFAGPDELDVALSFEGAKEAGLTLGSGAVLVLDDQADLPDFLGRIAAFFRAESCGQCVPCRIGTVRQEEALARLFRSGSPDGPDRRLLADVGAVMGDASICGLGQTAAVAIASALAKLGPLA